MMLISTIIICIGIVSRGGVVDGDRSSGEACQSWENLKKEAENFSDVQLQCNINDFCTGIYCDGKYEAYSGKLEVQVQHCSPPVSVEVHLSVPKLGIMNWSQTFLHGERVPVPSSVADARDSSFIEVYLKPFDGNASVTFGVSIVSHSLLGKDGNPVSVVLLKNETVTFPPCPYKKLEVDRSSLKVEKTVKGVGIPDLLAANKRSKLFGNAEPKVPTFDVKVRDKVGEAKSCDLTLSARCGEGEMCKLNSSSSIVGVCICLPNYYRNSSGICQTNPSVPSTTANPNPVTPQAKVLPTQTSSQTAISIVVPVAIIIVLSTLVVLAYKYRWMVRLRTRFLPSRRYEEMVIDGDEVGNIQSTGSDPIA